MIYHRVESKPVIGLDADKDVVLAGCVLGRIEGPSGLVRIHVATWEAGRGQREDRLDPAEFESWRRTFVIIGGEGS